MGNCTCTKILQSSKILWPGLQCLQKIVLKLFRAKTLFTCISDFSSGHFAERVYSKLTFPRFFVQTKSLLIRCKKILPVLDPLSAFKQAVAGSFLKKGRSSKFDKIHRRTPVLESLFYIIFQGYTEQIYLKRDSSTGVSLWMLRNFCRTSANDCFWSYVVSHTSIVTII